MTDYSIDYGDDEVPDDSWNRKDIDKWANLINAAGIKLQK